MPHSTKSPAAKAAKPRINRSISFPAAVHDYVTRRAQAENRSFNFIVNECLAKAHRRVR